METIRRKAAMISLDDAITQERERIKAILRRAESSVIREAGELLTLPTLTPELQKSVFKAGRMTILIFHDIMKEIDRHELSEITITKERNNI